MTSTLTWQQLRDLKRSVFEDAGDRWHEVSSRSATDRTRVDRAMSKQLRDTQESESAEKALGRLQRLSRNFQYLHTECGLVRTALNGLAADLAAPQRRLQQALEDAATLNLTVHQDGSVSFPAAEVENVAGEKRQVPGGTVRGGRLPLDPQPLDSRGFTSPYVDSAPGLRLVNPHAAKAEDVAHRITQAVNAAREVDARYAKALNELKAEKGLDVTAAMLKDAAHDTAVVRDAADAYLARAVPEDKTPAERRAWWENLGEEQRQEYLVIAPDLIGSLDGIPAATRDEANRTYLPVLIAELAQRTGDDDAQTKLDALRMIQDKLNQPSHPPMYLLGIGEEGNGRAIVSYGNPDTSRHVSAYVPGLDTSLNETFVKETMVRAQNTAIGARKYDPSSASIVWLGYDAPQLTNMHVLGTGDAERGAPAYSSFMDGLQATNRHSDLHLTAIGHSYGSLTVGTAAKEPGGIPGVDDVILLGSPGVGVDRAEDLGVGKEHVFVGAADNDIVTHLPSKTQGRAALIGAGVGSLAGPVGTVLGTVVAGEISDPGSDDLYFGKDPASEAFGAQRFQTLTGPHPVTSGDPFQAHSNYFTPQGADSDPVSASNIALIVAGKSGEVVKEEYR
ncbi:alpha/beta hydrolase [Streptomyces sp. CC228A]|uniref:alpha/beta hydrolase n=1 Tax=Streptomyces sp. CC228A TaxID=2898186 RepID=UPI001F196A48|nr:alpha/beta hydrolase [Streptomyces sp. CC228A]